MESAKFKRTTENFTCVFCGTQVKGNGYTNHCPECLTSLHVDVNPGDRASDCHGLMFATGYTQKNGKEYIIHQCQKCSHTRPNKVTPEDSREAIIALSNGTIDLYRQKLLLKKQRSQ